MKKERRHHSSDPGGREQTAELVRHRDAHYTPSAACVEVNRALHVACMQNACEQFPNYTGRYAYRLTAKGVQVALLFVFFHKRLCGPLANSRFHHKPDPAHRPNSKLEAAYHKADNAIEKIVDLLAAA